MRHFWLIASLIALNAGVSSCAGKMPAPPAMERCTNLSDHFRCLSAEGKAFSDPYPGKEPLMCTPVHDWEARKNWESVIRQ